MMKKLLLLVVTVFVTISVYAQVYTEEETQQEEILDEIIIVDKRKNAVSFGAKVGANISTMCKYKPVDLGQGSGIGFEGGAVLAVRFGKRTKGSDAGTGMFGVQIEPSYVLHTISTDIENIKLSYFEMPILLKVFVTPNLNIEVGPSICGTLSSSPDHLKVENTRISTGDIKGFDFKACVGISYETKEGLFASLRYNLGTSELANNFPCKVNAASLTLGYKFNIFKF